MFIRKPTAIIRAVIPMLLFFGTGSAFCGTTQANALLQEGRVDDAAANLHELLAEQPGDALAHQLLCRVNYSQQLLDAAIHECERAVALDPNNSDNHLWLGRAYGIKAERANPISALKLAVQVRTSFERAVKLDPENVAAMSDLGQFYVEAPSLIGGGLDKAQGLAARMMPHFPAQAHRILALAAEKKNDDADAEAEFLLAVAAGKTPEAFIDLGNFYQRHKQSARMIDALQSGIAADRRKGPPLVDAASILTQAHTSPELAENLLRTYLASPAKTDEAPAFKVHVQLGDLLARRGDADGAHREYASALNLASNYAPARKAMQQGD